MPVSELLQRISSKELTEWMLYEMIEPFGSPMHSYRFGVLAALVASMFGKKSAVPADFMWDLSEERKANIASSPTQTVEQMKRIMLSLAGKGSKKGK